jgi:hypothetical protein
MKLMGLIFLLVLYVALIAIVGMLVLVEYTRWDSRRQRKALMLEQLQDTPQPAAMPKNQPARTFDYPRP